MTNDCPACDGGKLMPYCIPTHDEEGNPVNLKMYRCDKCRINVGLLEVEPRGMTQQGEER